MKKLTLGRYPVQKKYVALKNVRKNIFLMKITPYSFLTQFFWNSYRALIYTIYFYIKFCHFLFKDLRVLGNIGYF